MERHDPGRDEGSEFAAKLRVSHRMPCPGRIDSRSCSAVAEGRDPGYRWIKVCTYSPMVRVSMVNRGQGKVKGALEGWVSRWTEIQ